MGSFDQAIFVSAQYLESADLVLNQISMLLCTVNKLTHLVVTMCCFAYHMCNPSYFSLPKSLGTMLDISMLTHSISVSCVQPIKLSDKTGIYKLLIICNFHRILIINT